MPDPLEEFLIDYVDAVGGLADEIEPQVFDVLMPDVGDPAFSAWAETPQRITFDPDALPEHPSAQTRKRHERHTRGETLRAKATSSCVRPAKRGTGCA